MNYNELEEKLYNVRELTWKIEAAYIANGGEVTEVTEQLEAEKEAAKADLVELLQNDGADMLGRWLKSKEDDKKALKAEKDYVTRQIAACDRSIDFVKDLILIALDTIGTDAVKGVRGYAFKATTSTTTTVDKEVLKGMYQEAIEEAAHHIGVPEDVTITLGASVSKVAEGEELPAYYLRSNEATVRFTKPRAGKDEE